MITNIFTNVIPAQTKKEFQEYPDYYIFGIFMLGVDIGIGFAVLMHDLLK